MDYILKNLAPILAATAAALALSAGYAALIRPGGAERRLGGTGGRAGLIVTAAVSQFWLGAILAGALILAPAQAGAWTMALGSAVIIWIGFVVPVLCTTQRFRGAPWSAVAGDAAAWLAIMLAQAAVLHLIGLTKP